MDHISHYRFEEHPIGCIITGADRQSTLITLTPIGKTIPVYWPVA